MIIKLNNLEDLKKWWSKFKEGMRNLDPKAVKVDPDLVEQHVVNILSIPREGWVGLNVDNNEVLGFLIMKRELSLLPIKPTYKTLLYHFAPLHRQALFELFDAFETDSQQANYIIETNYPRMFHKAQPYFNRHSIILKRDYETV